MEITALCIAFVHGDMYEKAAVFNKIGHVLLLKWSTKRNHWFYRISANKLLVLHMSAQLIMVTQPSIPIARIG